MRERSKNVQSGQRSSGVARVGPTYLIEWQRCVEAGRREWGLPADVESHCVALTLFAWGLGSLGWPGCLSLPFLRHIGFLIGRQRREHRSL